MRALEEELDRRRLASTMYRQMHASTDTQPPPMSPPQEQQQQPPLQSTEAHSPTMRMAKPHTVRAARPKTALGSDSSIAAVCS